MTHGPPVVARCCAKHCVTCGNAHARLRVATRRFAPLRDILRTGCGLGRFTSRPCRQTLDLWTAKETGGTGGERRTGQGHADHTAPGGCHVHAQPARSRLTGDTRPQAQRAHGLSAASSPITSPATADGTGRTPHTATTQPAPHPSDTEHAAPTTQQDAGHDYTTGTTHADCPHRTSPHPRRRARCDRPRSPATCNPHPAGPGTARRHAPTPTGGPHATPDRHTATNRLHAYSCRNLSAE